MKISLNWLKEFVSIPKNISPEKIGEMLTLHTAEVEGIEDQAEAYKKMVIGKVITLKAHPNADKLQLAETDIGEKKNVQIVCGGQNLTEGMLVAIALPGAWVKWHGEGEPVELSEAKIRGESSHGMICAGEEIGLETDNSEGANEVRIKDLSHLNAKPGTPLAEALNQADYILDIDNKSLTHRPDLWGHYGIARELAVILKKPLKPLESLIKFKDKKPKEKIKITILEEDLCPRFSACIITNLKIKESPQWVKSYLQAAGVRAINNVVDITNYVMIETGQPMHAYDRHQMKTDHLEARYAKEGEIFEAIDHKKYKLTKHDGLVTNGKVGADLAGIMGGVDTEINNNTTEILLEAANWNPVTIRKSSTLHGIRSDASQRFEKGLDPALTEIAIKRAIDILSETCPELKVITPITTVGKWKDPNLKIKVRTEGVCSKAGIEIPVKEMIRILKALEFEVTQKSLPTTNHSLLTVTVPSHRATGDVNIEEDIVEEITRIYGYDQIPAILPQLPINLPKENEERFHKHASRSIMAYELGFTETLNYSFYSTAEFEKCGLEEMRHVKVLNALSSEQTHMRVSMVPGILKNIVKNQRTQNKLKLFEIGRTYIETGEFMPLEEKWLSAAIMTKDKHEVFYDIKAALETFLKKFRTPKSILRECHTPPPYAHPKKCIEVLIKGNAVGYCFELHPAVAKAFAIEARVGLFELNFTQLVQCGRNLNKFEELPKFPAMPFDISLLIDRKKPISEVERAIQKSNNSGLIRQVKLFDIYEGKGIPEGKKSLAFNIELRHDDHTVTDTEFHETQSAVFAAIEKVGGEIRGTK